MNKTYFLPFILFIVGIIITTMGATFKIMHWPCANIALIVGMLFEITAGIILIVRLLKIQNK